MYVLPVKIVGATGHGSLETHRRSPSYQIQLDVMKAGSARPFPRSRTLAVPVSTTYAWARPALSRASYAISPPDGDALGRIHATPGRNKDTAPSRHTSTP